jgi:hypothetical protein
MPPRLIGGTAGKTMQIRLVDGVGAGGEAVPSTPENGYSLVGITREFKFEDQGLIMIHTDGVATEVSIASADVYGFYGEKEEGEGPNDWGPLGAGGGGIASGALNEGAAVDQRGTSKIMLLESIGGMRSIERIAVALGAITAATGDPVVHVDLILTRASK